MVCVLDDESGERVVWDGLIVLSEEGGWTATVTDLADNAGCTVTEEESGGAVSVTISPDTFVVDSAGPVTVEVDNYFDIGALSVTKRVVGTTDAVFEITLVCVLAGEEIEVPGGAVRSIADGETVVYDPLPLGAECVVTETDTGGADQVEITGGSGDDGNQVTVGDEDDLVVVNTFDEVDDQDDQDDDDDLPFTGLAVTRLFLIASMLILLGVSMVRIRRTRLVT